MKRNRRTLMGYRSDVAYVIRFDKEETLREFAALVSLKGEHERSALNECIVQFDDFPELCFEATDVKWYDSYEDVQAHQALLDFASNEFGDRCAYRFIRIGEDDDDVVRIAMGNQELEPYEEFYISRTINVPFYYQTGQGDIVEQLDRLTKKEKNNAES